MIVVDASVLTNAFSDDGDAGKQGRAELARDEHWAAPEHVIVEVFSAVRGLLLGNKISVERAEDALLGLEQVTLDLVATIPLLTRMWELRNNLTGYDAAYVALAEVSGCALVTADVRLGRIPDLDCEVRIALTGIDP